MVQEFITSNGKVIRERDVLFVRNLNFSFRDTIFAELFSFLVWITFSLFNLFETEKDNADYFGAIFFLIMALFHAGPLYDILFKRSLSNRISLNRITSFQIKPDEVGLETFVILHLKSGRYKKINFRTLEKQYEPFTELVSQHIIQPQFA
jgi:hypothetical protein